MIRHVVMWRLRDVAKGADWPATLERVLSQAATMRMMVPGLLKLELGENNKPSDDAADLVLYVEFDSWEALRGYETHPSHVEFKALIGPLRAERRVVDYET